ncbi:hypothetical protein H0H92_001918 [Tricholoma furcatifolium]|nr:hypothetical protein H0H92_001918 [Tricholoma furcatifolium]
MALSTTRHPTTTCFRIKCIVTTFNRPWNAQRHGFAVITAPDPHVHSLAFMAKRQEPHLSPASRLTAPQPELYLRPRGVERDSDRSQVYAYPKSQSSTTSPFQHPPVPLSSSGPTFLSLNSNDPASRSSLPHPVNGRIVVLLDGGSREVVKGYKQAKRRDDGIAIVTSCSTMRVDEGGIFRHAKFAYGGMAACTISVPKTQYDFSSYRLPTLRLHISHHRTGKLFTYAIIMPFISLIVVRAQIKTSRRRVSFSSRIPAESLARASLPRLQQRTQTSFVAVQITLFRLEGLGVLVFGLGGFGHDAGPGGVG